MIRVSFILILIAGLFGNSFCQDSVFIKNRWQIEGGINMLIPIRNYTEEYGLDCFDCQQGKFYVKPRFTISNFLIDFNYRHTYYKEGKNSFFGTKMGIGYKHLEKKQVKEGYYYDYGNYFEGTITTTEKVDFIFLEFALNHNFLVKQKVWITNQIDFEFDFLFHFGSKYTGNYSYWGVFDPSLNMNYELLATVPVNKHIMINAGFETPILIVDEIIWKGWREEHYRSSPWLSSPYTNSREKFAFILFRVGIIYVI